MTTTADNPLIAERKDSTEWYTGIGIAEGIADVVSGVESGSWIEGTIGGVSTSLEALGVVLDPIGSLVSWGVAWLMEHVKPLSDALDWLAGDPDQISAYAQTWRNVARNTIEAAGGLREAVWRDLAQWAGAAADAYRSHAAMQIEALASISKAANGLGALVEGAGLLVALVREMVRDLIADFISVLAVRLPMWLAEAGFTLGLATPLVISQVGSLVAKWVAKISKLLLALINSLRKLTPLIRRLGDLIDQLKSVLRKLNGSDPTSPNNPRGPDADGDGRPDGLDPDADGDGKVDDFDGDGRPDVPPPIRDGPTMPTREMDPHYRYETDPDRTPFREIAPPGVVRYLDETQRESHRLFVRDGLIYQSDGSLFDTTSGRSVHDGGDGRAIFVMDGHGNIYASTYQQIGDFHHSSFLGGQPVAGAGELRVVNGRLEMITDHSGHYRPGRSMTNQVIDTLRGNGVTSDFDVDYWAPEGT